MKPRLFLAALALLLTTTLLADTPGKWESASKHTRHSLTYSTKATLLGQSTPIDLVFGCDPTSDKQSSGTLGFDLSIKNVSKLKSFPFNDFEGPDAVAAPDVRLTITRPGKPALTFKTPASGFYTDANVFVFIVAEVSKKAKSNPRSILKTLASEPADSLTLSIIDPRDPKHTLELSVPVTNKQADFQTVLTGLK